MSYELDETSPMYDEIYHVLHDRTNKRYITAIICDEYIQVPINKTESMIIADKLIRKKVVPNKHYSHFGDLKGHNFYFHCHDLGKCFRNVKFQTMDGEPIETIESIDMYDGEVISNETIS